jgi:uridylate kinase
MAKYKRIILKLSGEALSNGGGCFDAHRVDTAADVIARLAGRGVQTAVVIGGGNIWRGRFTEAMNPVNADQMGMLATVINALCVEDALIRRGCAARAFTAQQMDRFARLYTAREADAFLTGGGVALLAGGTGNPFFTTDTAAALRAAELKADAVFKGTTVEGVYDCDPKKNPNARLIRSITYQQAIDRGLRVMDTAAFQICKDNSIPEVRVFSMDNLENVLRVADGDDMGTVCTAGPVAGDA